jgi:hypothetical protein
VGSNPTLSATFLAFGSSLSARAGFQGRRARRGRVSRLGSNPTLSATFLAFGSSLSARAGFQGRRARRGRVSRLGSIPTLSTTFLAFGSSLSGLEAAVKVLFASDDLGGTPVDAKRRRLTAHRKLGNSLRLYKAQALRLSTCDKPRVVACPEDHPQHIGLPRGCLDDVRRELAGLGVCASFETNRRQGVC